MRRVFLSGMLLALLVAPGCGEGEVKPDPSLTPKVDQADVQKKIQESMQKGGYGKKYGSGPSAESAAPAETPPSK